MIVSAYAKINWTLDITGTRTDGYHLMDTVMQQVSLCDTLSVESSEEISLTIDSPWPLLADEGNLIVKALRVMQCGAKVHLQKRIPLQAGLGGGSADAAAVMLTVNKIYDLGLTIEQLCQLGVTLGADVPFCLVGGACRAQGIGEVLSPLPAKKYPLLLIKPQIGFNTRAIFAAYDAVGGESPNTPKFLSAYAAEDTMGMRQNAANALQRGALLQSGCLQTAMQAACAHDAVYACLTGSGSAIYALFGNMQTALDAQEALRGQFAFVQAVETLGT